MQPGPGRAVANHYPAAFVVGLEKCLDIFLYRDSPDIELNRARQAIKFGWRRSIWREAVKIDPATPVMQSAYSLRTQLFPNAGSCNHHGFRWTMKPANIRPERSSGQMRATGSVRRELGMIRGRKRDTLGKTIFAGSKAQWPLCGDVNGIGRVLS